MGPEKGWKPETFSQFPSIIKTVKASTSGDKQFTYSTELQLLEEVLANKKVGIKVSTTLSIKVIERKTKTPTGDSKKTGNHKIMTPLCRLEFHVIYEPWTTFILPWPYLRLAIITLRSGLRQRQSSLFQATWLACRVLQGSGFWSQLCINSGKTNTSGEVRGKHSNFEI